MFRCNPRLALLGLACRNEAKDEFGIAKDRNIGVVHREDELSATLLLSHNRHNILRDETIVEIAEKCRIFC